MNPKEFMMKLGHGIRDHDDQQMKWREQGVVVQSEEAELLAGDVRRFRDEMEVSMLELKKEQKETLQVRCIGGKSIGSLGCGQLIYAKDSTFVSVYHHEKGIDGGWLLSYYGYICSECGGVTEIDENDEEFKFIKENRCVFRKQERVEV